MIEPGCYYAFGITGSGKTFKIRRMLEAYVRQTGCGYGILDSGPATEFVRWPHESTKEACLEKVVAGYSFIYTPRSIEEVAYIIRGLHDWGKSALMWDECANDLQGVPYNNPDMLDIARRIRCWRQAGLNWDPNGRPNFYGVTTQNPQELPKVFWSTGAEVYGFRLEEEDAREILKKRCGFDPAELFSMPMRENLTLTRDRRICRSPGAPAPASPPPARPAGGNEPASSSPKT